MFSTYRKVLVIAGLVFCLLSYAFAYSGGSGEPNNPYQISNVSDWNDLMHTSSDWNKYFIMTADVNLYGVTLTPVGNDSTQFTGVFDGNDNIISNAVINQPGSWYVGLFGYVGSGGQIRNLGVENVNITGRDFVGGLVGWNEGTLTSCYVTGLVTGTGTVNPCIGGLVGVNYSGSLTACYATGSVSGTHNVGGLVGGSDYGTLIDCFWDIQTSGQETSDGGTGKTTAEMKQVSTFANWDFVETWGIEDNQTYPFLKLTYPVGNLNYDKVVDFFDFAILASHWLEDER